MSVFHTAPENVLSPKGSVANLRVLLNTGAEGWSVASMQWNGKDSLGIRWNGDAKNPIGNPQSRGIPTWFILPEDLAAMLRGRFGNAVAGITEDNTDITRVRVRPLPLRIWQGEQQEPSDDEWVLSITDRSRGNMEIVNPGTGHFMPVHSSHVMGLVRDTVNDAPNGPKHGILSLNVQITFEDGRIRLEPLQSLAERMETLADELHITGYEGQHSRVHALVQEARRLLSGATGSLGPWEKFELDYADIAVADNFLQLALASVAKAIAVNKLPPPDYQHGFSYGHSKSAGAASQ
jgi:hypothetical protein